MRRHLACILLCALLLGLCACGGGGSAAPATGEKPLELAAGQSYSDIYLQYLAVRSTLLDSVEMRIEGSNAALKESFPDSYYMNSNYLVLSYLPFSTVYPDLVSTLTDDGVESAQAQLRSAFPDAQLTQTAPGRFEAAYTYVDKTSGQAVDRAGSCIWERDGKTGSFRVRASIDGELVEFTEFIPQGNDTYLLYTMTDVALVQISGGKLRGLQHVHRISDPPLGPFGGDMRLFDLAKFDPFPAGAPDDAILAFDADANYLLTLSNDVMTYTGKVAQDITDAQGNKTGVTWQSIDPITLLD